MSPNQQNPDRGIETKLARARQYEILIVPTNRIPTEGLKHLVLGHHVMPRAGPNQQNPDRGIETL